MSNTMRAASGWDRVENGQAQPEHVELWDAINEVVAASGGSTSCTSLARQKAVVRVHQAVTSIVAASLARATAPHRGDICMVRVPEPEGGMEECSQTLPCPRHGPEPGKAAPSDAEIEAWRESVTGRPRYQDGDCYLVDMLEIAQAVALMRRNRQPADRTREALRGLVEEKREQLAELQSTAAAVFLERDELREQLRQVARANETKANSVDQWRQRAEKAEGEVANLRVRMRVYQQIDAEMAKSRLREMRDWTQKNVDPADGQVAMLEEFDRLIGDSAEKRAESPTMFMERVDHDLMALAKHPGSNLYHVKDNDRPMFVLADSWGEAVAAYEAMVRSENDMEPDEEVEILGVDFVANRRDILVAPIDVEAD